MFAFISEVLFIDETVIFMQQLFGPKVSMQYLSERALHSIEGVVVVVAGVSVSVVVAADVSVVVVPDVSVVSGLVVVSVLVVVPSPSP